MWPLLIFVILSQILTSASDELPPISDPQATDPPNDPTETMVACGSHEQKENKTLIPRRYIGGPASGRTGQRSSRPKQPFHILFVIAPPTSRENAEALQKAFNAVDTRLSQILKVEPLEELRVPRDYDTVNPKCVFPEECLNWPIPSIFHYPCFYNSSHVPEQDVPLAPSPEIKREQDAGVSLVAFVRVVSNLTGIWPKDHCDEGTIAYATPCLISPENQRPTHGHIGICAKPSQVPENRLAGVLLHEILHVITGGPLTNIRRDRFTPKRGPDSMRYSDTARRKEGKYSSVVKFLNRHTSTSPKLWS